MKHLVEPRAIEDLLKTLEGKYNSAVSALEAGKVNHEATFVIAGFIGHVLSCSPAAMRMNSAPMKAMLEQTASNLDNNGEIPNPPSVLARTSSAMPP